MRAEILIPIFLSFPVGIAMFLMLTKNIEAHLRSWKDRISFFIWPFPPYRMLIIQELDGEVNIYYDYDFEEIKSENRTLIKTIDGQQYVTEIPPSEASITVSMFDAKAPSGYYSPFAISWRWIVATSFLVYMIYYALVVAWIPPIEIQEVSFMGKIFRIAVQKEIDPWEVLLATTLFFSVLTWYLSNIVRMNDATIAYAWYHAKGINPPHVAIVPIPGISSVGLLDYLRNLGREIKIVISEDVAKTVTKIMQVLEKKKGSRTLAAIILAKLAMSKTWRQALARVLREKFDLAKTGEAHAMIRLGIQPITKRIIPILLVVGIICFTAGYAVGNAFSIGIAPAANQTTTSPPRLIPPSQSQNATTSPPYSPAKPPPPPGPGGK